MSNKLLDDVLQFLDEIDETQDLWAKASALADRLRSAEPRPDSLTASPSEPSGEDCAALKQDERRKTESDDSPARGILSPHVR